MNKKMLKIMAIVFVIFIVALVVFIRFMPAYKIPTVLKTNRIVSQVLCLYPVQVRGSSMEPKFKEGERVNFNKCFNQNELEINNVVLFNDRGLKRMATVREVIKSQDKIIYKAFQEARIDEIMEINPEQIIAIYKD